MFPFLNGCHHGVYRDFMHFCMSLEKRFNGFKAIVNGPVGQVLAGPLFLKVKTKFHSTKCSNK